MSSAGLEMRMPAKIETSDPPLFRRAVLFAAMFLTWLMQRYDNSLICGLELELRT